MSWPSSVQVRLHGNGDRHRYPVHAGVWGRKPQARRRGIRSRNTSHRIHVHPGGLAMVLHGRRFIGDGYVGEGDGIIIILVQYRWYILYAVSDG